MPQATPLQTDDDGMAYARQEFQARSTEFTGYLSAVREEMNELQRAWGGEASRGFINAMGNWCNAFQVVITNLDEMTSLMGESRTRYNAVEMQNTDAAGAFNAALPGF